MSFVGDKSVAPSLDGYCSNDDELYWTLPPLFVGAKSHSLKPANSNVGSSQQEAAGEGASIENPAEEGGQEQVRPASFFTHAAITELELAASALGVTAPSHEQYMKAAQFQIHQHILLTGKQAPVNDLKDVSDSAAGTIQQSSAKSTLQADDAADSILENCRNLYTCIHAAKLKKDAADVSDVSRSVLNELKQALSSLQEQLNGEQKQADAVERAALQQAAWLVQLCGETCDAIRSSPTSLALDSEMQQLGSSCVLVLSACFKIVSTFHKSVFSQLLPCRIDPSSVGNGYALCSFWEAVLQGLAAMATWPALQQQALHAAHACLTQAASTAATQLASRINRDVDVPQPSPVKGDSGKEKEVGMQSPAPQQTPTRQGMPLSSPPPGLHTTPFTPTPPTPSVPGPPTITTEDAMDKEAVQLLWCLLWAGASVMASIPELTVLGDNDGDDTRSVPDAPKSPGSTASKSPTKGGSAATAKAGTGEPAGEGGVGESSTLDPDGARRGFFELCMAWTRRSEWMGAQLSRMLTKRPDSLDGNDALVAAILQQRNDVLSFIVHWSTTWLCLTNEHKSTQQMDKLKRHAMKLITHSLEIYTMVSFPLPQPAHATIPTAAAQAATAVPLHQGGGKPAGRGGDKFWTLQWGGWQLIRPLGKGSSAQVWKARYHHADVALKLFQLDSPEINPAIEEELDNLRQLASHPNVVRFLGACWRTGGNGAQLAVMMEYCNAGTLHNTIDNARQPSRRRNNAKLQHFYSSWANRLEVAQNVAAAVAFLHSQGVPHRDLTSYNVLLHYSDPWQAKVADLGLARLISHPDMDLSTLESMEHGPDAHWPAWIAPELFKAGAQHDCRADVYSFGVILWELIMLRHPWEQEPPPPPPPGVRPSKAPPAPLPKPRFVPGDHPVFPANPSGLEESMPKVTEVIDLAEQCWQLDPAARPTMHTVVVQLDSILSKVQRMVKV